MDTVVSTIALNVLSNFITDALKWAKGTDVPAITRVITSTELLFPELDGVAATLRQWLVDDKVIAVLSSYVEGHTGTGDLPIEELVSVLLTKTQFYLPEHSQATAEKIISAFVTKLRAAYVADPEIGIPYIANRADAHASQQQAGFAAVEQHIRKLRDEVQTSGGLKPSLQAHFDSATATLGRGDYPSAKALFESLLQEVRMAPVRDNELERRVNINLANIASALGDYPAAVPYYRKAAEMDADVVRQSVNAAIADLLELKSDRVLSRLGAVQTPEPSSNYEFWSVKVNALAQTGRFDDAISAALSIRVPEKEAHASQLLGYAYMRAERLPEAEAALRRALELGDKRPESRMLLAEVLFTPVREYHSMHPAENLTSELKARVDDAASHLESSVRTLRDQGRARPATDCESNLAVMRGLQGRFRELIQLLEPIAESGEATASGHRNLALAYVHVNELTKATRALEQAMRMESDSNTELMYVQVLKMAGEGDRALEFCSQKAVEPVTAENLKWHVAKAEALVATRKYSKALQVLTSAQRQFSGNAEVLLNLAELYELTAKDDDATLAYEEALKNATGVDELRVRHEYGGFCLNRQEYSRAVNLWRPLVNRQKPNSLLDYYMVALYNTRKLAEAATIASGIKAADLRPSLLFAEIAASVYERLDYLKEVKEWLEYLCNSSGNKPKYVAKLSGVYLRLGQRDEALELLDASCATLKQAADLMNFAQSYSSLGKHHEAVGLAGKAVTLATDPEIHMGYIAVFMAADHEVLSPEEISTFQDVMGKFKERFPRSSSLESFQVDPDNPLAAIREKLIKHSERVKAAVQLFKERRLPLAIFARFIGRDLYETWTAVAADPGLVLHTAAGTGEEAAEFSKLLKTASGFMVDTVALFTMTSLGLLGKLTAIGDIFVAQRALDSLHELQARTRFGRGRASGTIGMIDGQFFMTETSAEDHEKSNVALDKLTEWAESHAKPLGLKNPLTRAEKKWLRPLGVPNVATLVTANQHGLVLLTDDKSLADIGKANFGVPYVNSQAVLTYLLDRGSLTAAEHDRAVLSLVDKGYTFTRITTQQICAVIAEEQFQLTRRVKRVLATLESPPVEPISASVVVAQVLRQLYLESIPEEIREAVAFHMLDILAMHRTKVEVQRLVFRSLRHQMSPILAYQHRRIEDLLSRWGANLGLAF